MTSPTGTLGMQQAFGIEIRKVFRKRLKQIYNQLDRESLGVQDNITVEQTIGYPTIDFVEQQTEKIKFDLSPIFLAFLTSAWVIGNRNTARTMKLGERIAYNPNTLRNKQQRSYNYIERFVSKQQTEIRDIVNESLSQGDSITDIKTKLEHTFRLNSWESELVSRSEVVRTYNESVRNSIQTSGATNEYEWFTSGRRNVCPVCTPLNRKVYNVNDPRAPMPVISTHPLCFIDWQVPVFTVEGYKPIGKIKVGDLVLTKEGKFRKVTKLFFGEKYRKN